MPPIKLGSPARGKKKRDATAAAIDILTPDTKKKLKACPTNRADIRKLIKQKTEWTETQVTSYDVSLTLIDAATDCVMNIMSVLHVRPSTHVLNDPFYKGATANKPGTYTDRFLTGYIPYCIWFAGKGPNTRPTRLWKNLASWESASDNEPVGGCLHKFRSTHGQVCGGLL